MDIVPDDSSMDNAGTPANWEEESLESIPMPPEPSSGESENEAWKKAQEALQKIQPKQKGDSSQMDSLQMMYKLYPWMQQFPTQAVFSRPSMTTPTWWPSPGYSYGSNQPPYRAPTSDGIQQPELPRPTRPLFNQSRFSAYRQSFRGRGRGFQGAPRATGGNTEPLGGVTHPQTAPPLASPPRPLAPSPASTVSSLKGAAMPDGMMKYIERAYMAVEKEEDKNIVEQSLKQRLMPLLNSGRAWTMDWEKEPLPTDANFSAMAAGSWTPAAQLKKMHQTGLRGRVSGAGRNVFQNNHRSPERSRWKSPPRQVVREWKRHGKRKSESLSSGETSPENRESKRRKKRRPSTSDTDEAGDRVHSAAILLKPKTKETKHSKNSKQKQKKGKQKWVLDGNKEEQEEMRQKRAQRFADSKRPPPKVLASRVQRPVRERLGDADDQYWFCNSPSTSEEVDLSHCNVLGTCQTVEKPYLRLTTAPDASQVRPESVLVEALQLVKERWRDTSDYFYAWDQLKSIRQDMTIQCIRSSFAVDAYETHARIALEKSDREEFNQCQTQLRGLYKEIPGCPHEFEFTAYRLLYFIYMENTLDMTTQLAELSEAARAEECVSFALSVRRAWSLQTHHKLLALYARAPRMSSYVMDLFLDRERKRALKKLLKAYRPSLPLEFVMKQLGFWSVEACREWLTGLGVSLLEEKEELDCRQGATLAL